MSSGAFPSLYSGNEKESLFNSAQIALGFLAYTEHFPSDEKILLSELDLLSWFVENVDKVDADIHYKKDFVPSYYTRVVWPCLLLAKKYKHRVLKDKAFHLLDVIINRSLGEGDFPRDAGFSGGPRKPIPPLIFASGLYILYEMPGLEHIELKSLPPGP